MVKAPFVAQYLHEMLAASLNHAECESNVYIDDALYRGDKSKILLTYEAGGIPISVEKSKFDLRAGEEIEYLGVSVNIQERYYRMIPERRAKIARLCRRWADSQGDT